jgi:hypothetical protein
LHAASLKLLNFRGRWFPRRPRPFREDQDRAFRLAIAGEFLKARCRLGANHTAKPGLQHGTGYRLLEKPLMMSLPFVLFACGLGAAWLRQREVALGFWTAGLVVLLALFRAHYGDPLNIAL